tara:strand:+ start:706 stop:1431 length:726 start_codon:yes stop_codon:yes gene_type:complete
MSYIEHFKELRNRLIYCFIFLFLCFGVFFYNAELIGNILSKPLYNLVGHNENKRMIFTGLPEVFVSYLKIALFASILSSFPFFILQFSLFITPALYKKEKKFFLPIFYLVPILFYTGVLFAYFILVPVIWNFFLSFESTQSESFSIELESRFGEYIKLIMYLLFSCGLSFLFPILLIILSKLNIVNVESLRKQRKYFFVGILIFSAIFTPPDIISQLGIAIPLFIFYELAILLIKILNRKN